MAVNWPVVTHRIVKKNGKWIGGEAHPLTAAGVDHLRHADSCYTIVNVRTNRSSTIGKMCRDGFGREPLKRRH